MNKFKSLLKKDIEKIAQETDTGAVEDTGLENAEAEKSQIRLIAEESFDSSAQNNQDLEIMTDESGQEIFVLSNLIILNSDYIDTNLAYSDSDEFREAIRFFVGEKEDGLVLEQNYIDKYNSKAVGDLKAALGVCESFSDLYANFLKSNTQEEFYQYTTSIKEEALEEVKYLKSEISSLQSSVDPSTAGEVTKKTVEYQEKIQSLEKSITEYDAKIDSFNKSLDELVDGIYSEESLKAYVNRKGAVISAKALTSPVTKVFEKRSTIIDPLISKFDDFSFGKDTLDSEASSLKSISNDKSSIYHFAVKALEEQSGFLAPYLSEDYMADENAEASFSNPNTNIGLSDFSKTDSEILKKTKEYITERDFSFWSGSNSTIELNRTSDLSPLFNLYRLNKVEEGDSKYINKFDLSANKIKIDFTGNDIARVEYFFSEKDGSSEVSIIADFHFGEEKSLSLASFGAAEDDRYEVYQVPYSPDAAYNILKEKEALIILNYINKNKINSLTLKNKLRDIKDSDGRSIINRSSAYSSSSEHINLILNKFRKTKKDTQDQIEDAYYSDFGSRYREIYSYMSGSDISGSTSDLKSESEKLRSGSYLSSIDEKATEEEIAKAISSTFTNISANSGENLGADASNNVNYNTVARSCYNQDKSIIQELILSAPANCDEITADAISSLVNAYSEGRKRGNTKVLPDFSNYLSGNVLSATLKGMNESALSNLIIPSLDEAMRDMGISSGLTSDMKEMIVAESQDLHLKSLENSKSYSWSILGDINTKDGVSASGIIPKGLFQGELYKSIKKLESTSYDFEKDRIEADEVTNIDLSEQTQSNAEDHELSDVNTKIATYFRRIKEKDSFNKKHRLFDLSEIFRKIASDQGDDDISINKTSKTEDLYLRQNRDNRINELRTLEQSISYNSNKPSFVVLQNEIYSQVRIKKMRVNFAGGSNHSFEGNSNFIDSKIYFGALFTGSSASFLPQATDISIKSKSNAETFITGPNRSEDSLVELFPVSQREMARDIYDGGSYVIESFFTGDSEGLDKDIEEFLTKSKEGGNLNQFIEDNSLSTKKISDSDQSYTSEKQFEDLKSEIKSIVKFDLKDSKYESIMLILEFKVEGLNEPLSLNFQYKKDSGLSMAYDSSGKTFAYNLINISRSQVLESMSSRNNSLYFSNTRRGSSAIDITKPYNALDEMKESALTLSEMDTSKLQGGETIAVPILKHSVGEEGRNSFLEVKDINFSLDKMNAISFIEEDGRALAKVSKNANIATLARSAVTGIDETKLNSKSLKSATDANILIKNILSGKEESSVARNFLDDISFDVVNLMIGIKGSNIGIDQAVKQTFSFSIDTDTIIERVLKLRENVNFLTRYGVQLDSKEMETFKRGLIEVYSITINNANIHKADLLNGAAWEGGEKAVAEFVAIERVMVDLESSIETLKSNEDFRVSVDRIIDETFFGNKNRSYIISNNIEALASIEYSSIVDETLDYESIKSAAIDGITVGKANAQTLFDCAIQRSFFSNKNLLGTEGFLKFYSKVFEDLSKDRNIGFLEKDSIEKVKIAEYIIGRDPEIKRAAYDFFKRQFGEKYSEKYPISYYIVEYDKNNQYTRVVLKDNAEIKKAEEYSRTVGLLNQESKKIYSIEDFNRLDNNSSTKLFFEDSRKKIQDSLLNLSKAFKEYSDQKRIDRSSLDIRSINSFKLVGEGGVTEKVTIALPEDKDAAKGVIKEEIRKLKIISNNRKVGINERVQAESMSELLERQLLSFSETDSKKSTELKLRADDLNSEISKFYELTSNVYSSVDSSTSEIPPSVISEILGVGKYSTEGSPAATSNIVDAIIKNSEDLSFKSLENILHLMQNGYCLDLNDSSSLKNKLNEVLRDKFQNISYNSRLNSYGIFIENSEMSGESIRNALIKEISESPNFERNLRQSSRIPDSSGFGDDIFGDRLFAEIVKDAEEEQILKILEEAFNVDYDQEVVKFKYDVVNDRPGFSIVNTGEQEVEVVIGLNNKALKGISENPLVQLPISFKSIKVKIPGIRSPSNKKSFSFDALFNIAGEKHSGKLRSISQDAIFTDDNLNQILNSNEYKKEFLQNILEEKNGSSILVEWRLEGNMPEFKISCYDLNQNIVFETKYQNLSFTERNPFRPVILNSIGLGPDAIDQDIYNKVRDLNKAREIVSQARKIELSSNIDLISSINQNNVVNRSAIIQKIDSITESYTVQQLNDAMNQVFDEFGNLEDFTSASDDGKLDVIKKFRVQVYPIIKYCNSIEDSNSKENILNSLSQKLLGSSYNEDVKKLLVSFGLNEGSVVSALSMNDFEKLECLKNQAEVLQKIYEGHHKHVSFDSFKNQAILKEYGNLAMRSLDGSYVTISKMEDLNQFMIREISYLESSGNFSMSQKMRSLLIKSVSWSPKSSSFAFTAIENRGFFNTIFSETLRLNAFTALNAASCYIGIAEDQEFFKIIQNDIEEFTAIANKIEENKNNLSNLYDELSDVNTPQETKTAIESKIIDIKKELSELESEKSKYKIEVYNAKYERLSTLEKSLKFFKDMINPLNSAEFLFFNFIFKKLSLARKVIGSQQAGAKINWTSLIGSTIEAAWKSGRNYLTAKDAPGFFNLEDGWKIGKSFFEEYNRFIVNPEELYVKDNDLSAAIRSAAEKSRKSSSFKNSNMQRNLRMISQKSKERYFKSGDAARFENIIKKAPKIANLGIGALIGFVLIPLVLAMLKVIAAVFVTMYMLSVYDNLTSEDAEKGVVIPNEFQQNLIKILASLKGEHVISPIFEGYNEEILSDLPNLNFDIEDEEGRSIYDLVLGGYSQDPDMFDDVIGKLKENRESFKRAISEVKSRAKNKKDFDVDVPLSVDLSIATTIHTDMAAAAMNEGVPMIMDFFKLQFLKYTEEDPDADMIDYVQQILLYIISKVFGVFIGVASTLDWVSLITTMIGYRNLGSGSATAVPTELGLANTEKRVEQIFNYYIKSIEDLNISKLARTDVSIRNVNIFEIISGLYSDFNDK